MDQRQRSPRVTAVSWAETGTRHKHSVTVHVAQTREAAEIGNKLAGHAPVGGLFHSTC